MITKIIKDIYPKVIENAPLIASALGINKVGEAAMWALYLIGRAFGVSMDQIEKLPHVIGNDPDHCDKLCQIEKNFGSLFEKVSTSLPKNIQLSNIEINIKVNFDPKMGLTSVN